LPPNSTGSSKRSGRSLPAVADHVDEAREELLAFAAFPKEIWRQIWSNNPRTVEHDADARSGGWGILPSPDCRHRDDHPARRVCAVAPDHGMCSVVGAGFLRPRNTHPVRSPCNKLNKGEAVE
jgi:hypothetical protein